MTENCTIEIGVANLSRLRLPWAVQEQDKIQRELSQCNLIAPACEPELPARGNKWTTFWEPLYYHNQFSQAVLIIRKVDRKKLIKKPTEKKHAILFKPDYRMTFIFGALLKALAALNDCCCVLNKFKSSIVQISHSAESIFQLFFIGKNREEDFLLPLLNYHLDSSHLHHLHVTCWVHLVMMQGWMSIWLSFQILLQASILMSGCCPPGR